MLTAPTCRSGAVNNACQFTNGAGTCSNGVCTFTSCSTPGYYLVDNQCVSLNLQTDTRNWCARHVRALEEGSDSFADTPRLHSGSVGTVCPAVANGVAGCSSGTCNVASCNPGYVKVTTGPTLGSRAVTTCRAVNTDSDRDNCGTSTLICARKALPVSYEC